MLATVVCVLNPEVVVVGGDLASTSLITGIRETLYGLNRIVVDAEFGAEAVNRALPTAVRAAVHP